MPKSRFAVAPLILLVGSTPSIAKYKDELDPRIRAAIACSTVGQNEERLRCYDQAVNGLRLALESGQLVPASEATKPLVLEGVVKAAGGFGFNKFWMELDSGDRWAVTGANRYDEGPERGSKVSLRKGVMSGYWLSEPGSPDRRAKYLGRF